MLRTNTRRSMGLWFLLTAAGSAPAMSFQFQCKSQCQFGFRCQNGKRIINNSSSNNNNIINHNMLETATTRLFAAGKGFGKKSPASKAPTKSYGKKELEPIKDLIDEESGMREFFESNEPWQPLFRSIIRDDSVPATSFLGGSDTDTDTDIANEDEPFEFSETTSPWKKLAPIPTDEADIAVLGQFLDAMQTSLIEDIPVDETTKDDDNDLHFIEEGRRMLVCSRYHVVQGIEKNSVETFDRLFAICWSELVELRETNEADTGSLIVTPGFDYDDLRRFVDMNLQRPMQWLGVDGFEVASLEKGGLGVIRIIHKLSDIPTELPERG